MAKKLRYIEVHPGKNGGHRIVHEFEREPMKRGGSLSGGMVMERPEREEHLFGPEEATQHKILTHIAKALGFTKIAKAEAAEDEAGGEE